MAAIHEARNTRVPLPRGWYSTSPLDSPLNSPFSSKANRVWRSGERSELTSMVDGFGKIVLWPRPPFEPRVFVDRQRPVIDVALDNSSVPQLDAEGIDIALDATTDGQLLRDDIAVDSRAIGDHSV